MNKSRAKTILFVAALAVLIFLAMVI